MRKLTTILALAVAFTSCKNEQKKNEEQSEEMAQTEQSQAAEETDSVALEITPISHATSHK